MELNNLTWENMLNLTQIQFIIILKHKIDYLGQNYYIEMN